MTFAARRMQTLIKDLLTYSRISLKAAPYTATCLNDCVDAAIDNLEVQITQTRAIIKTDRLAEIEADPSQISRLFQNLIGNSLKFVPPGRRPEINIHCVRQEGAKPRSRPTCCILVKDNGIGFDTRYLDKLFKPFERLHDQKTYEGSGIGLAICKRIVERHGGRIEASSTPGKGSTFTIILPLFQTSRPQ